MFRELVSSPQPLLYLHPGDTPRHSFIDNLNRDWKVDVVQHSDTRHCRPQSSPPHVGVLHLESLDRDHLKYLQHFITQYPNTQWVALATTECLESPQVQHLITENCCDYFTLPLYEGALEKLDSTLGHALGMSFLQERCRKTLAEDDYEMVGTSPNMLKLFKNLRKVSSVDATILITGESGTGKELIARAVHERSRRHANPFIAVNCGALPEALVQSELFGHEKGAFTGANNLKIGQIEAANGGTLFLDEIGDLPLEQQVNLLRFLQEKNIRRVGSTQDIPVDVRVLAATHVDLEQAVREGRFREDLLYRLNVLQLTPPPLRERGVDIEVLARFFFQRFQNEGPNKVKGFSDEALDCIRRYTWPGNVRELINRVRRAIVMCESRLISPADLGLSALSHSEHETACTLKEAREHAEQQVLQKALVQTGGNMSQAARQLGVSRITLYRLLDKYQLNA